MFKCALCHGLSEPKERATKVVISSREKTYAPVYIPEKMKFGRPGRGWEIIKEVLAHKECAETV